MIENKVSIREIIETLNVNLPCDILYINRIIRRFNLSLYNFNKIKKTVNINGNGDTTIPGLINIEYFLQGNGCFNSCYNGNCDDKKDVIDLVYTVKDNPSNCQYTILNGNTIRTSYGNDLLLSCYIGFPEVSSIDEKVMVPGFLQELFTLFIESEIFEGNGEYIKADKIREKINRIKEILNVAELPTLNRIII